VVFGQSCAMNWAGPAYDDVGLALSDALWRAGYPADLIPATEIGAGSLAVDADGYVRYGPQQYRGVVLYHPQFEGPVTAEFFRKAAKGKSRLYRIGAWTQDFDGKPFDGPTSLPRKMNALADPTACAAQVVQDLKASGVAPQAPATRTLNCSYTDLRTVAPPAEGECRLLDGTHILVSGARAASGDPVQRTVHVDGHPIAVDAVGMVAIRLGKRGRLEALAAGGLKSLSAAGFKLELPDRVDLALWRDSRGRFHGALQGWTGTIPPSLQKLTDDWLRLSVPVPLE
jgi:hypothetical protein